MTMHETLLRVESPGARVAMWMIEFNAATFFIELRSFGLPSHARVDYQSERGGMPLHDTVGIHCQRDTTTENQGAGAWYMGVCVW